MTDYGVIIHNTLNTFHFAGVASKSNVTRANELIEAGKTAAGTKQLLSDRLRGQYKIQGNKVTFLSGYEKDENGDEKRREEIPVTGL